MVSADHWPKRFWGRRQNRSRGYLNIRSGRRFFGASNLKRALLRFARIAQPTCPFVREGSASVCKLGELGSVRMREDLLVRLASPSGISNRTFIFQASGLQLDHPSETLNRRSISNQKRNCRCRLQRNRQGMRPRCSEPDSLIADRIAVFRPNARQGLQKALYSSPGARLLGQEGCQPAGRSAASSPNRCDHDSETTQREASVQCRGKLVLRPYDVERCRMKSSREWPQSSTWTVRRSV